MGEKRNDYSNEAKGCMTKKSLIIGRLKDFYFSTDSTSVLGPNIVPTLWVPAIFFPPDIN
jgi:hypothetical protein